MPLDPRIPLMVQQPQIQSPFEVRQNALQIRAQEALLQDRQAEREAKRAAAQQEATRNQLYAKAYGSDGKLDRNVLLRGLADSGMGAQIPELQKGFADQDKAEIEADKARLMRTGEQMELIGRVTAGVKDQASYDQARQMLAQAGVDLGQIPDVYDPTFVANARNRALTVSQQVQQEWKGKEYDLDVEKFQYGQRNDAENRAVQIRGQNMVDSRARQQMAINAAGGGKEGRQMRRDEGSLRKEFDSLPDVKAFNDVRQSYLTIKGVAANPSAPNDIALIFSYMKMLDPGSVVREGEFATAQNAAGIPDRIRNVYNKAISGERLNPGQRNEFVRSAGDVYSSRVGRYNDLAERYRSYAADYGADPERVARPEPIQRGAAAGKPTSSAGGAKPAQNTAPTKPATKLKITSKAEYDRLPSGTQFIAPDGSVRRKP
ncbi:hypothetical protein N8I74_15755 [Chitiniphilus purpureus]|uniref:Uncharacterized protein n=1 Tax=Chitiniphilus purpureus TaxID=2981137 RepID=A0ABY6DS80_9NEIS|nr:hypothetical protein [Chitiniphilus sp. CD1]UXY14758.1 hypothetical protein N8I74_15755 [Chitiniphilus sp. CD1]